VKRTEENTNQVQDSCWGAFLDSLLSRETTLFMEQEKAEIQEMIASGALDDPDKFISYAYSVINRRKRRMGLTLEKHLEFLFKLAGLDYTYQDEVGHHVVDFTFPSSASIRDGKPYYYMLSVKSTCNDRWRTATNEATECQNRYFFTLDDNIPVKYTEEMRDIGYTIVAPESNLEALSGSATEVIGLSEFIRRVREDFSD